MNPRKDLSREYAALQERLGASQGKKYWRTLEELADDAAFQELVRYEFPEQADVWPDFLSRRRFLTLMGASLALAGVGGCSVQPAPSTQIVPYVHPPEEITPGKPLFYATAMTVNGHAVGLLVESHLGRPTKIEGNPNHPASLGATDLFNQAAVLELYDPDRSQTVTHLGQTSTWDEALATIRAARDKQLQRKEKNQRGAGLRLLTGRVVSPTLAAQLAELRELFPAARWHQYEPIHTASSFHAATWAFGTPINVYHDFTRADVVVSLDADFLTCGPGRLRNVHDFMARRRLVTQPEPGQAKMNRLYVIETNVTSTGAKADHRLALRAWEIEKFARALASRLGIKEAGGEKLVPEHRAWIEAIARDLDNSKGRCAVLAGDRQPAAVHLLAHRINHQLGNVGKTVLHTEPIEARPAESVDELTSLENLLSAIDRGEVDMLGIIDCNPAAHPPGPFSGRNRPAMSLASPPDAFPGRMERHPRLRRHRLHRAAAHSASLPGPFSTRDPVRGRPGTPVARPRDCEGVLEGTRARPRRVHGQLRGFLGNLCP
jgi:MoCo/4Fe-4S cofactor protein with predicted Tat translocation signal